MKVSSQTSYSLQLTSLYHALYRFKVRLLASRKEEDRKGFGTARTTWDAILCGGRGAALSRHALHCLHSVLCVTFIVTGYTSEVMSLSLPIHFYIYIPSGIDVL